MLFNGFVGDIPLWVKDEFKEILSKDSKIQENLDNTIINNKIEITQYN